MTDDQKSLFLSCVTEYEELKEKLGQVSEELQNLLKTIPLGTYIQDEITGVVHKVIKPLGHFTYYKDLDYVRTAKLGEERGSLSKKEALAANFTLSGE